MGLMLVYKDMKDKHKFIVQRIEPREGLLGFILASIENEKRRLAKIRLLYASATGILSIATLVPMTIYFINQFWQSGFYQYLSLVFSNGGLVATYWKELLLSLAESLPVLSIMAVLILVLVLLTSSKYIIRNTQIAFA